jgi:hypothetical protein
MTHAHPKRGTSTSSIRRITYRSDFNISIEENGVETALQQIKSGAFPYTHTNPSCYRTLTIIATHLGQSRQHIIKEGETVEFEVDEKAP